MSFKPVKYLVSRKIPNDTGGPAKNFYKPVGILLMSPDGESGKLFLHLRGARRALRRERVRKRVGRGVRRVLKRGIPRAMKPIVLLDEGGASRSDLLAHANADLEEAIRLFNEWHELRAKKAAEG